MPACCARLSESVFEICSVAVRRCSLIWCEWWGWISAGPDGQAVSFFRVATDRVMAGPKHAGCHIGGLAVAVAGAACVGLDQLNTVVTEAG